MRSDIKRQPLPPSRKLQKFDFHAGGVHIRQNDIETYTHHYRGRMPGSDYRDQQSRAHQWFSIEANQVRPAIRAG
jgi:hypothetical protein